MKWLLIQYEEEDVFGKTHYIIDCIFDNKLSCRQIRCSKIPLHKKLNYKTLEKYLEARTLNSDEIKKLSITKDTIKLMKQFLKKEEVEFKKVLNFYEIEKKEENDK